MFPYPGINSMKGNDDDLPSLYVDAKLPALKSSFYPFHILYRAGKLSIPYFYRIYNLLVPMKAMLHGVERFSSLLAT